MALDLINLAYPFDPTGERISNKITGEQQILRGADRHDYYFIIPTQAPYFASTLVMTLRSADGSVRQLVYGVDYYHTHWFVSASRACAKPVYGSISFLNQKLKGIVTMTYQTIGGIWTQDAAKIAQILADRINNPRNTTWDVVIDMPVSFPPIDHEWDYDDMVGQKEIQAGLAGIENALRTTGSGGIASHLVDFNNPHKTNKTHVGLGDVRNLRTATPAEANAGASDDLYMTPRSTASAIQFLAGTALTTHVNDKTNPHGTTAAQTGAYDKNQVDVLLTGKVDKTGVAYDSNRFGGRLPAEFTSLVLSGTAANSSKFGGQTPAEFKAELMLEGSTNAERFGGMTVSEFLATQTIGNSTLFAGKNATEYAASVLAGTAANAAHLEGKTIAQIMAGQAGSAMLFGGQTAFEFKAELINGTVNNATKFGGKTPEQFLAGIQAGDSTLFGGMTVDQYKAFVLTGKAADSNKLAGFTIESLDSKYMAQFLPRAAGLQKGVSAPIDIAAVGSYWVLLGKFDVPTTSVYYPSGDGQWLVCGGEDAQAGKKSTLHLLRIKVGYGGGVVKTDIVSQVMNDSKEAAEFGFSISGTGLEQEVAIWRKVSNRSTSISLVELSAGDGDIRLAVDTPVNVQPVNYTIIPTTVGSTAAVDELRLEVEEAFDAMTVAFQNLATQLNQ
jgi:hypothetical protein